MSASIRGGASAKRASSEGAKSSSVSGTPITLSQSAGRSFELVGDSGGSKSESQGRRHSFRGADGRFAKQDTSQTGKPEDELAAQREKIKSTSRANSRASSNQSLRSIPEGRSTLKEPSDAFFIGSPTKDENDPRDVDEDDKHSYMSFEHAAGILHDLDDALSKKSESLKVDPNMLLRSLKIPNLSDVDASSYDAAAVQNDLKHHENTNESYPRGSPQVNVAQASEGVTAEITLETITELRNEIESDRAERREAKEEIERDRAERADLIDEMRRDRTERQSMRVSIDKLNESVQTMNNALADLKRSVTDRIDTCSTRVDDLSKRLDTYHGRYVRLEDATVNIQTNLEKTREELTDLEPRIARQVTSSFQSNIRYEYQSCARMFDAQIENLSAKIADLEHRNVTPEIPKSAEIPKVQENFSAKSVEISTGPVKVEEKFPKIHKAEIPKFHENSRTKVDEVPHENSQLPKRGDIDSKVRFPDLVDSEAKPILIPTSVEVPSLAMTDTTSGENLHTIRRWVEVELPQWIRARVPRRISGPFIELLQEAHDRIAKELDQTAMDEKPMYHAADIGESEFRPYAKLLEYHDYLIAEVEVKVPAQVQTYLENRRRKNKRVSMLDMIVGAIKIFGPVREQDYIDLKGAYQSSRCPSLEHLLSFLEDRKETLEQLVKDGVYFESDDYSVEYAALQETRKLVPNTDEFQAWLHNWRMRDDQRMRARAGKRTLKKELMELFDWLIKETPNYVRSHKTYIHEQESGQPRRKLKGESTIAEGEVNVERLQAAARKIWEAWNKKNYHAKCRQCGEPLHKHKKVAGKFSFCTATVSNIDEVESRGGKGSQGGDKGKGKGKGSDVPLYVKKIQKMSPEEREKTLKVLGQRACTYVCDGKKCPHEKTKLDLNAGRMPCPYNHDAAFAAKFAKEQCSRGASCTNPRCRQVHPKGTHSIEVNGDVERVEVDAVAKQSSTTPYTSMPEAFARFDNAAETHVTPKENAKVLPEKELIGTVHGQKWHSKCEVDWLGQDSKAVVIPTASHALMSGPQSMSEGVISAYIHITEDALKAGALTGVIADHPCVVVNKNGEHKAVPLSTMRGVPQIHDLNDDLQLKPGLKKIVVQADEEAMNVDHTTLNRPGVGASYPCRNCGGCEHWADACLSGKGEAVAWPWSQFPTEQRKVVEKKLAHLEVGKPRWYWTHCASSPRAPWSKGCIDLNIDKFAATLHSSYPKDEYAQPKELARCQSVRIFVEREEPKVYAERKGTVQEAVEFDRSEARGVMFIDEVQKFENMLELVETCKRVYDESEKDNVQITEEAILDGSLESVLAVDDVEVEERKKVGERYQRGLDRKERINAVKERLAKAKIKDFSSDISCHVGCRCPGCVGIVDVGLTKARKHACSDDDEKRKEAVWHGDTVPLKVYKNQKAVEVTLTHLVQEKHNYVGGGINDRNLQKSAATLKQAKEFKNELLGEQPKRFRCDDGKEFKGDFKRWIEDGGGVLDETFPYSQHRNGRAESQWRLVKNGMKLILNREDNAPDIAHLSMVHKYVCQSLNLFNGAIESVHGKEASEAFIRNMLPFGALIRVKDNSPDKLTFDAAGRDAAFLRCEADGVVFGELRLCGSEIKLVEGRTQNYLPIFSNPDENGVKEHLWYDLSKTNKDKDSPKLRRGAGRPVKQVDEVLLCEEGEELYGAMLAIQENAEMHEAAAIDAVSSEEINEGSIVELADEVELNLWMLGHSSELCVINGQVYEKNVEDVASEKGCKSKGCKDVDAVHIYSPAELKKAKEEGRMWHDSGRTIAEMKAEADAKEAAVYVKHNVVDFESAHTIEQSKENARKRFKETGKRTNHIVISAIHYDKNAEDSSRRAFKCRSVCKIERDLLTMQKNLGTENDEKFTLDLPTPTVQKLMFALNAGKGKEQALADEEGAYLPVRRQGIKCVATIPQEWYPEHILAKFPPGAKLVVDVLGSPYGSYRAGFDYDKDAHERRTMQAWRPLSSISGTEERVYLREMKKDAKDAKSWGPDCLTGYVDDTFIGSEDVKGDLAELEKKPGTLTSEFINEKGTTKLLGNVMAERVQEIERKDINGSMIKDKIHILTMDQTHLIKKALAEFRELLKSRGQILRDKKTPLPVAPSWFEESKKEKQRVEAGDQETTDAPGWLSEFAEHYVGIVGFLVEWSRGDCSFSRVILAGKFHNWTTKDDASLIHLMGYLQYTQEKVLFGYISEYDLKANLVANVGRSDASNASDVQRRTGVGCHSLTLEGPYTNWTYHLKSKAFTVPALSSQEDEVASSVRCTRGLAMTTPIIEASRGLLLGDVDGVPTRITNIKDKTINTGPTQEIMKLDATCAIKVCMQGSKSVAHMRRSRAVEAAFLARYWAPKGGVVHSSRKVEYEPGATLSVDVGTKSVGRQRLDMLRPSLGIIDKRAIPSVTAEK